jgi:hypothetical protein
MKKILGIAVISLLWPNLVSATTYAVEFTERSFLVDLTIAITERSFLADETWNIKGTCTSALSYSTVEITERSFLADMTIALTDRSFLADKDICIKNPNSLPEWFIEIINDL